MRTDRWASHTASDLPVPGCRCILKAVKTAGPTLRRTETHRDWLGLELGQPVLGTLPRLCWEEPKERNETTSGCDIITSARHHHKRGTERRDKGGAETLKGVLRRAAAVAQPEDVEEKPHPGLAAGPRRDAESLLSHFLSRRAAVRKTK